MTKNRASTIIVNFTLIRFYIFQANYSGNLHENMCPMNAYPVPMKMNYPGNDHPFPQQISNQFGGYNASNQSNARAPLDSEGTASNTKNKKGKDSCKF